MKYYVASDIHSFYSIFRQALEQAGYFDDPEPHQLLLLGDYLDRGPEPLETIAFLQEELAKGKLLMIRGNHEDLYQLLVTEDHGFPFRHHLHNGTYETALKLTGYPEDEALEHRKTFCEKAIHTDFYQKLLPEMMNYYETPHYVFVHGWVPCEILGEKSVAFMENWREADCLDWDRARWINGMAAARQMTVPGKTVVCGHWHTSYGHSKLEGKGSEFGEDADFSPYEAPGVLAIDACTCHSHRVNVVILED